MQASTAEFDKTKLSDLKSYTTLGVGTFSRVALIEHRRTGKTYALKRMEKKTIEQLTPSKASWGHSGSTISRTSTSDQLTCRGRCAARSHVGLPFLGGVAPRRGPRHQNGCRTRG